METKTVLIFMLGTCLVIMFLFVFSKPLKSISKILARSLLGIIGIIVVNGALSGFGLYVGVNLVSASVTGLFGIPGFILLYAVSYLLSNKVF